MTNNNANLSLDFLVGFTFFLLAFIWVISLIPGLFNRIAGLYHWLWCSSIPDRSYSCGGSGVASLTSVGVFQRHAKIQRDPFRSGNIKRYTKHPVLRIKWTGSSVQQLLPIRMITTSGLSLGSSPIVFKSPSRKQINQQKASSVADYLWITDLFDVLY